MPRKSAQKTEKKDQEAEAIIKGSQEEMAMERESRGKKKKRKKKKKQGKSPPTDDVINEKGKEDKEKTNKNESVPSTAKDNTKEVDKKEVDKKEYVLTTAEYDNIEIIKLLGIGSSGKVHKVCFQGEEMAMKTFHGVAEGLWVEVEVLRELAGAGGAPLVRATCSEPPAMVITFAGKPYWQCLARWSDRTLVSSLVQVAERLQEIHDAGRLHNDIQEDNVTVTFAGKCPEVHFVDFGLSTEIGGRVRVARPSEWLSPELLAGRTLTPASDVYSLGFLVKCVLQYANGYLAVTQLQKIPKQVIVDDPTQRPSLQEVKDKFKELLKAL